MMQLGQLLFIGLTIMGLVMLQRWYAPTLLQRGHVVRMVVNLGRAGSLSSSLRQLCVCDSGTTTFELIGVVDAINGDGTATVVWSRIRNLLLVTDTEMKRCALPARSKCQWNWGDHSELFGQVFPTRVAMSRLSRAYSLTAST